MSLSKSSDTALALEEEIVKVEIIQALKTVASNYSFSSADRDNKRFQFMFPDSKIAQSYKQSSTKIKYVIQYGMAPYVVELLLKGFENKSFTFIFDETTTSQIRKQLDGYVRFWSSDSNQISTRYCGSIFLGYCDANHMLEHFKHIKGYFKWDNNMLHVGMDGPNINKSFEKKLSDYLNENSMNILNLGSCSIHKVCNAFRKGLNCLDIDIDQFAYDIHFFFKLSSARREYYTSIEDITETAAAYAMKHVSTR